MNSSQSPLSSGVYHLAVVETLVVNGADVNRYEVDPFSFRRDGTSVLSLAAVSLDHNSFGS